MIRKLHFSDFLKLGRLHTAEVGLNLPDSLVIPNSPLSAALLQKLPVHSLNSSVYVFIEEGKPEAFAQAIVRKHNDEWNVLALGVVDGSNRTKSDENSSGADSETEESNSETQTGLIDVSDETEVTFAKVSSPGSVEDNSPENIQTNVTGEQTFQGEETALLTEDIEMSWLRLLEYLVTDAGEKGVVRVYAKLSTESPEMNIFSQTGFHTFTHEGLLTLRYESALERPVDLKIRPQRKRDLWNINQLYNSLTPSFVKNSEQMLAKDWDIHKGYFPRPVREYGWLVENEDKVVAYIRITSNRNKHMMRIMNLDTQRETLSSLVQFALTTLKAGSDTFVYCSVREYQTEQEAVLEDLGFSYFGKQAVMVKHTVQYIRNSERALAANRDRKLELARSAQPNLLVRLLEKLPFKKISIDNR